MICYTGVTEKTQKIGHTHDLIFLKFFFLLWRCFIVSLSVSMWFCLHLTFSIMISSSGSWNIIVFMCLVLVVLLPSWKVMEFFLWKSWILLSTFLHHLCLKANITCYFINVVFLLPNCSNLGTSVCRRWLVKLSNLELLVPRSFVQEKVPKRQEIPSRHHLVQCQQSKHQHHVWHLFKINKEDTGTTPITSFWCFYCWRWTNFIHCSGVNK